MVTITFRMLRIVLPWFDIRRIYMIEPAAPIIPCDKDRRLRPQSALYDGVDLVYGPLHAVRDIADQRITSIVGIRSVFARVVRRINP